MKISDAIYKIRTWITDAEVWLSGNPNKIVRRYIRKYVYKKLMKWIVNKI